MNTAIIIDCRTRELEVSMASVTKIKNGGLVLRKAMTIGGIKSLNGQEMKLPIILFGEYQAMSSAGFVRIIGVNKFSSAIVVGGGWLWLGGG